VENLIQKYNDKLFKHGLTERDAPLIGTLDAEIIWNRTNKTTNILEKLFKTLNINSIIFSEPAEPYKTIIEYLTKTSSGIIYPEDCETRTFLHELPYTKNFDAQTITNILKERKSLIIPGHGIITFGTVSPEQAFVTFSSVCFAVYIKFFSDYLEHKKHKTITNEEEKIFNKVTLMINPYPEFSFSLMKGPFNKEQVYKAMDEAGKITVKSRLVDSYFGNISYLIDNIIHISQTGSSLDELDGYIDTCPIDNSSCAGITASSEFSAHKQIYLDINKTAILHGHPKFSVILSMDCNQRDMCKYKNQCHTKCPYKRFVNDIPIVPGEVGTGPYGLYKTIPSAIKGKRGVIVYGHGVFTACEKDFNEAFNNLLSIEKMCKQEYFKRVNI